MAGSVKSRWVIIASGLSSSRSRSSLPLPLGDDWSFSSFTLSAFEEVWYSR